MAIRRSGSSEPGNRHDFVSSQTAPSLPGWGDGKRRGRWRRNAITLDWGVTFPSAHALLARGRRRHDLETLTAVRMPNSKRPPPRKLKGEPHIFADLKSGSGRTPAGTADDAGVCHRAARCAVLWAPIRATLPDRPAESLDPRRERNCTPSRRRELRFRHDYIAVFTPLHSRVSGG
jgi:hypothetical protein